MNNNKNLISKAKKFYENKNFFEAKSCLLSVLKNNQLEKSFKLSLYILISDICYKINDYENAEKFLLKCINQGKLSSQIYLSLGNIYLKKRDYKNSEKFYIKSIDYKKENEIALINLAILYHNLGKKKEAIKLYKKVLKINETNIGALYNLSKIDDSVINIKVIERLKNLIKKKKISNFNLASSFFLLADVEKKKKNFDKEIELITKGNNFSFKENEFKNNQYNNYWLKGISKKVNKISFIKKTQLIDEVKNIYPIFIIGLPRCGSTLIESIISSGDDKVENLGETNLVNWALLNTYRNFNNQLLQNKKIDINVDKVFEKLNYSIKNLNIGRNDKKIFFSEKSLENFYYIELILNMYPNAKFIHPHRDIIDNIFAIYNNFYLIFLGPIQLKIFYYILIII